VDIALQELRGVKVPMSDIAKTKGYWLG
jgi:hypothetical protein